MLHVITAAKIKIKKNRRKAATATLNTQSGSAMANLEIDLTQIGDCEFGNSKSDLGDGKSEIKK